MNWAVQSKPTFQPNSIERQPLVVLNPPSSAMIPGRFPGVDKKLESLTPKNESNTWFDDIISKGLGYQGVLTLWKMEGSDYTVRAVGNGWLTAVDPPSGMIKLGILAADEKGRMQWKPSTTFRAETNLKTSPIGSFLQAGWDLSKEPINKQLEYVKNGQPIVDLTTIGCETYLNLAGIRGELKLGWEKNGVKGAAKVVLRTAAVGAIKMGRTFVTLDPVSKVKTRFDFFVVAKAEVNKEFGLGASKATADTAKKKSPLAGDVEIQIRISRSDFLVKQEDLETAKKLARNWVDELAGIAGVQEIKAPAINTRNKGSVQQARYNVTHKLVSGTPVWQLLPHTGGKNHGHPVIDLALRLTGLLRSQRSLPEGGYAANLADASRRLTVLWGTLTTAEREKLAPQLANRLNINFGLPEVAWLNALAFGKLPMTSKERAYQALFR